MGQGGWRSLFRARDPRAACALCVAGLLMAPLLLPGVGRARRPMPPSEAVPPLARLVGETSRAVPELAARLAQVDVRFTRNESSGVPGFGYGFGALHPTTGRAVCDREATGVMAAGLAVHRLVPSILTQIGDNDAAAAARALPPFEHGSAAPASAPLFMDLASRALPGPTRLTRTRLRSALRTLGWSLRNLGRARAAPESRVIESVATIAGVAVVADPDGAPELVIALVTDVANAIRAAEANTHEARQRCAGVHLPGNPIITPDR